MLAALAAVGAIWTFSIHPLWDDEKFSLYKILPNLALPFLSILILAIVLMQSTRSLVWWAVFLPGYLILVLLLRAEYKLIGTSENQHFWYSILVISFSFGLFLLFTIALKNSGIRMFVQFYAALLSRLVCGVSLLFSDESSHKNYLPAALLAWVHMLPLAGLFTMFINPVHMG